ncbi:LysR family transcriptional regulator [Solidesulfovibrio magneticus]|uniref:HTH lysR-type domain-containing protein n=1 Tax=Solidesulfovibrio magneticus (strain ATCC 700980 / DSM 13731 / RS-1) TaxID=573370 RepID=C4XHV5_SOLM1|nr:LysR family transcriptional regulator [Solidesulfovibrio magneticus]BAH76473.1 hypothetical protein DMR_29820 [Solidesulfovibrio magneticus RS-1]
MIQRNSCGYDLNLLPLLLVLLEQKHVSRAAEVADVSQSSMSKVLLKARNIFGDDLLVRDGSGGRKGYRLTACALNLLKSLQNQLIPLMNLDSIRTFDPAESRRCFKVSASEMEAMYFLPNIMQKMIESGPGLSFNLFQTNNYTMELLSKNELDCSFWITSVPQGFSNKLLFDEKMVCLVSKNNFFKGDALSLDDYVSFGHVRTYHPGVNSSFIDDYLNKLGLSRKIVVMSHSFFTSASIASKTNLIASVPEKVAKILADFSGARIVDAPVELPTFGLYLIWNKLMDTDPGLGWFIQQLLDVDHSKC